MGARAIAHECPVIRDIELIMVLTDKPASSAEGLRVIKKALQSKVYARPTVRVINQLLDLDT